MPRKHQKRKFASHTHTHMFEYTEMCFQLFSCKVDLIELFFMGEREIEGAKKGDRNHEMNIKFYFYDRRWAQN